MYGTPIWNSGIFTLRSTFFLCLHVLTCHAPLFMPPLPFSILRIMVALNVSRGAILVMFTLVVSYLVASAEGFSLDRTPLLIANRRTGRGRTIHVCRHCASTSPLFSSLPVTSENKAGLQTDMPKPKPSRLQFLRQIVLPRLLLVAALFHSGYRLGVNTGGSAIIDSTTTTVKRSTRRFPILAIALLFFILRDLWRQGMEGKL